MQNAAQLGPEVARELREGALVAVQLADRIRAIDEQIARAEAQVESLASAANPAINPASARSRPGAERTAVP